MRVRVHHRARSEMIATDFGRRRRFLHSRVRVADDGQMIAEGLERAEASLTEIKTAACRGGIPEILSNPVLAAASRAVHLLDADQACATGDACRLRFGEDRACRDHRVKKWQRHTDPKA